MRGDMSAPRCGIASETATWGALLGHPSGFNPLKRPKVRSGTSFSSPSQFHWREWKAPLAVIGQAASRGRSPKSPMTCCSTLALTGTDMSKV